MLQALAEKNLGAEASTQWAIVTAKGCWGSGHVMAEGTDLLQNCDVLGTNELRRLHAARINTVSQALVCGTQVLMEALDSSAHEVEVSPVE